MPYFLKSAFPIDEIKCPVHMWLFWFMFRFGGACGEDIPFRLEVFTELASKPSFKGSEEDDQGVVSGSGGQQLVAIIV